MRLWTLSFLCGILLLQQCRFLPSMKIVGILLFISLLLLLFFKKFPAIKIFLTGILLGFSWIICYAYWQNGFELPETWDGKVIQVQGDIASIPTKKQFGTNFLFKTASINLHKQKTLLKLSWMNSEIPLHAGQEWLLNVKLKKIHGQMNPGSYDYEAYAYQNGIRAQGYVAMKVKHNFLKQQLLSQHWYNYPLTQLRENLKNEITTLLPATPSANWILALALGERENISSADWQVLRNTGTNHLMAIAGLHIGFMAALAHFITVFLWKRSTKLLNYLPAIKAGVVSSFFTALIYGALAGFSLPTQRACLMLSFFLLGILIVRNISVTQAWFIALFLTLLWNPLVILGESFWLSFASLGFILYGMSGRIFPRGLWWKWGRVQWVITIGLIPFGIWLFQEFSLSSFIANSIAIPYVEFLLVPLSFFATCSLLLSTTLAKYLFLIDDKLFVMLWKILHYFANFPHTIWYDNFSNSWQLLAVIIATLFLLAPKGFHGKYFSLFYFLPLFFSQAAPPQKNTANFSLLDVGQGLSAVVKTQHHVLVFDAGPKLSDEYDMGSSVVAPFLRTLAIKKIDMLVISHPDNDHIGGSYALIKAFPITQIKTSVPEKFKQTNQSSVSYCLTGESWNWDGVDFKFLYPSQNQLHLDNDSSCVLKISSAQKSILLTGDIEKFAEKVLVKNNFNDLATTLLIAPHHGSKTSIEKTFVNTVHPEIVLFPLGYHNRYHFPHPTVVAKYHAMNATMYDTANAGAIQLTLQPNAISSLTLYRQEEKKYWND